jgi:DNA mismatch repair protein MutL
VRQRISAFFGRELADGLVAVATTAQGVVLRGYVAPPSHNRPHQRMQYLFLNGRYIRDRALGHALSEAYRGLLLGGRYPICFLWFDVPPSTVDVNVHPTKLEVRFLDSGRLYSLLLGTLRERFLATDLTTRLQAPAAAAPLADPWTDDEPAAALDPRREQQVREDFVAWAKGQIGSMPPPAASSQQSVAPGITSAGTPLPPPAIELPGVSASGPTDESSGLLLRLNRLSRPAIAPPPPFPPDDDRDEPPWESPASPAQPGSPATSASMAISTSTRDPALPGALPPRLPSRGMQVHDRYLIAESDEGLLVIDQHALHERILYEQLRQRVLAGNVESQRLLVPEAVDLSPAEAATVLDQAPLLEKLGIRVEPFGGDTVLISAYPAMLANVALGDVLRSIIDRLLQAGRAPSARDLFDDLLHMIACKAAVKAGDRLNPEEISALLEQRHLVADTHHCPHGRPTALVLTRAELDRQFLRT